MRKGDAAGLARFFTLDAKSMGPNEPAHEGRAKIEAVYAGYIAEGATELSLTTTGVWGTNQMLAEEGLRPSPPRRGRNWIAASTSCCGRR